MKVILRENIQNVGNAGEIVKVSDGYARNFLLPRRLATLASKNNVAQLKHEQHQINLRQAKAKRDALKLAEELKQVSITISRQVGEEDRIFGSVTTRDVAEALREEGHKINRRDITLDENIRKLGVYEASVKLYTDVHVPIKLWVVAQ